MTGVSYMIPFVAAGGILIALGFLFGGDEVVYKLYGGTCDGVTYADIAGRLPVGFPKGGSFDTILLARPDSPGMLFVLGKIAFFMLVPILSGYHRLRASPIGPAWFPASSAACSPGCWAPASSAAWSPASPPAASPTS